MLMSAPLRCPRLVTCLMLVACGWPLLTPSAATSNDLHSLADLTHPYASIFSPLLKALSEHGGSRWNPGPGGKMTPEERYMTYLTEVYRKTSRVQRSVDGRRCDTVRLIKPQDECVPQSNKGERLKNNHNSTHLLGICFVLLISLFYFLLMLRTVEHKNTSSGCNKKLNGEDAIKTPLLINQMDKK